MGSSKSTGRTEVALGGRRIPLILHRHARARRISLRLSPSRDAIVMTLPVRASLAAGMKFFEAKADWVLAHVEDDAHISFEDGASLPVAGEYFVLRRLEGRGVAQCKDGELRIYCAPEFLARRVRDFLRKHLQAICAGRAGMMAQAIGRTVKSVRVGDTRSRWGSCSAGGALAFHWQLVFAAPAVLDYLIAHEVAHLKEMDHSPRFWQTVAALCPGYRPARTWLKAHGHTLHRYGA